MPLLQPDKDGNIWLCFAGRLAAALNSELLYHLPASALSWLEPSPPQKGLEADKHLLLELPLVLHAGCARATFPECVAKGFPFIVGGYVFASRCFVSRELS